MTIKIYTDGSSTGKVGAGGWGFVVVDSGLVMHEAHGGEDNTTNNQMELQAVIEALKYAEETFPEGTAFTIYSDSEYVVNGINKWLEGWEIKMKLGVKTVKNWDRWLEVSKLKDRLENVTYAWVRGHSGDQYNDIADKLAKTGKQEVKDARSQCGSDL